MPIKSPLDHSDLTLSIIVKINGEVIKDNYSLSEVNITSQLNRITAAELSFLGLANENGDLLQDDDANFEIGKHIEVLAGYGQEEPSPIFAGVITKQSLSVNELSNFKLKLSCRHQAIGMTFNTRDAEFSSLSDQDIIKKITQAYPLQSQIDSSTIVYETIFQKNTSDWDFMLARAGFNGFFVNCLDSDRLHIGKPELNAEPILELRMGVSIIEFNAELDGQNQASGIEASAWDSDDQTLITAIAEEPTLNLQGDTSVQKLSASLSQEQQTIFRGAAFEEQALKVLADGSLLRMRLAALRGNVRFQGSGLVSPGKIITLAGVGARYNGKAFVSAVTHQINDGNWFTTVEFGLENRPATTKFGLNSSSDVVGLSGIHGLQIATVKQLSDDPKSQFRIQVTLNAATTVQQGIWARIANFYATAGAGVYFLPEVGDEVIVGFLDADPSCPIVLGSLYSSSKAPNYTANNNNYIKAITTKAKLEISFNDEKKILSLSTPSGNTFVLDDENKQVTINDQNGNVVTMDMNGISLRSYNNINLVANGNIKLDATGGVEIKAANEAKISAMNIKHDASASFTAKGVATAELNSSGQTMVKGGIVMIN